jgi:APA family basic amino acid/polyamine antiporter
MTTAPETPPAPPAPPANGLERKLGLFPLTNIVIANMIGGGIFLTSGFLMRDLHHPVVMLALWLLGGLVAFCGALSYGELGAAIPRAGGEYAFLSRLYHPLLGFLSGWVSFFVGFSAPIAFAARGFSKYLTQAFPGLLHPGVLQGGTEAAVMEKLYAVLIIIAFTLLHTRGLEAGTRVQNGLTGLKVLLIIGLVAAGFAVGNGSLTHLAAAAPYRFDFAGVKTLGLSLMWIMFSYSGWNASAYIGSEVRDPRRNLPRSLLLGTGIVTLLYLALNLFYVFAIPPAQMEGVEAVAGLAVGNLFGQSAEAVLSLVISFAFFSSLSAYLILGPRVYYSMARDGIFFKSFAAVDPKSSVPTRSILLQGGIAVVMVLFGTIDQLLTYMGFSLGIFPLLAVFGVFKLRRTGRSAVKLPGYPVASAVYLLVGAAILGLAFLRQPVESAIAVATALAGVPLYLVFRKRSAGAAERLPREPDAPGGARGSVD